jgi:hypothetical protein
MSESQKPQNPKPITKQDVARIQSAEAKKGGGQTPAGGFVARVQRAAERNERGGSKQP